MTTTLSRTATNVLHVSARLRAAGMVPALVDRLADRIENLLLRLVERSVRRRLGIGREAA